MTRRRENERRIIRAVAAGEPRLYAGETIRRYGFTSSAAIRRALISLLCSDVI